MKTIRIPRQLLTKWLAALRSGKYQQCTLALSDGHGYCCLGVLEEIADGDVERSPNDGSPLFMPSAHWRALHGVQFFGATGNEGNSPYLPKLDKMADVANDRGETFGRIADAIEDCSEPY